MTKYKLKDYIFYMSIRMPEKIREKIWIWLIFFVAFTLRIIYLLQMKENPHFFSPTMDPLYHDAWAQNIASGNWIGEKVFFRAPFYAYFLAIVYKVFGHSYIIPRVIQHLVGSLSCVLVYFVAKKLFNRKVAQVSGLIAATYGMLLYFEDELLLDSFLVFFDLVLILFLLKAKESPKFFNWFICGLILGISAVTRPNILLFVPFVWLWIFLVFKKEKSFKKILAFCGLVLLGCILIISPVTLRNLRAGGDLVLIASQGGINFYIGNNKNSDGMSAIFYKEDWQYRDFQKVAEKEAGRDLKPSEISGFYYRKGLNFYLNSPGRAFKLLTKKLYLFWNRFEISNNQDIYFFRRYSSLIRILPLGFWFIGPLGLVGMILSTFRCRRSAEAEALHPHDQTRKASLPILFVFSYMVTVVMFFVTARFRLPVIPFLIIFSGFSLVWLAESFLRKDIFSLRSFFLLLIPFAALTNSNLYHLGAEDFSQAHFSLGNVYLKQGKLDWALAEFDSALALNPRLSRAHLNRGIVLLKKGEEDKAQKEFLIELGLNPEEDKAYNNLAAIYLGQGLYQKAEQMAKRALELKNYSSDAYMNLALSYWKRGQTEESKKTLRLGLSKVQPFFEAELFLGEIYLAQTKLDSAEEIFERIIQEASSPRDVTYDLESLASKGTSLALENIHIRAKAHFNLGTIYVQNGKLNLAEKHLRKALSLDTSFAEAYANLGILYDHTGRGREALPLLRKAIKLDPQNGVYHYNLGLAYAKQGKLEKAKEEFETSLVFDSTLTDAQIKLHLVDSLLQSAESTRKLPSK